MSNNKKPAFRTDSMRRLETDTHERLDYLAYFLRDTKENIVRECLLTGLEKMEVECGVAKRANRN